jgi:hypothetical protein
MLNFTVIEDGVETLARSVSFGSAMMWMILPPLALWLVWLVCPAAARCRSPRDRWR